MFFVYTMVSVSYALSTLKRCFCTKKTYVYDRACAQHLSSSKLLPVFIVYKDYKFVNLVCKATRSPHSKDLSFALTFSISSTLEDVFKKLYFRRPKMSFNVRNGGPNRRKVSLSNLSRLTSKDGTSRQI